MKTTQTADDCPNCGKHFRFANRVALKINQAIVEKGMWPNGKYLEIADDFELDI